MVSRSQEVATDAKQILHDTVNRCEPLELSGRLKTPHLALTLSGRLMGDLRAVVRVLIGAVRHRRHHRAGFVRLTLRAAQCRDAHSTIPLLSASLSA